MTQQVRVRFAPSPTGHLHIGGARTAIYNWAFARKNDGVFILRIDDTDPERSTQENTDAILRSLKWLGLNWDEGPEVGGDFGPYFQTQRFASYNEALEQLIANDAAYPCFCTAEELAAKREANQKNGASYAGYDRSCRDIPADEARARIEAGEPHVWRLKVPLDHGPVEFEDAVFGPQSFPIEVMDDFILIRSDGTPTYNFGTVIDDATMQISHIIRGDDHLSNTPRQILVYEALGAPVPTFAHLSMILGADGKRLSKRHGATSVEAYQEMGILPEALINYLALLGWSLDGETTKFSQETLCGNFSLGRISKNDAIFDPDKLDWMNQQYIKEMGAEAFAPLAFAEFVKAGYMTDEAGVFEAHREWIEKIYPIVCERIHRITEVPAMVDFLFTGEKPNYDEKSVEKTFTKDPENAALILDAFIKTLSDESLQWDLESLTAAMQAIPAALGQKPRVIFQVIRVAITGRMVSPPLFEGIELIGRSDTLARLSAAKEL